MKRNIFDLALGFYRSPAEHRELMDPAIPLPPDIGFLLDAITENKDPNADQPGELSVDLRTAIPFFIERTFFIPGADCYRILGLNYGAKSDEIRKHYNQLLHIFALDQVDKSGEWDAIFATQINRAYSVLRDPERRRAYDQALMRLPAGKGAIGLVSEGKMEEAAESSKSSGKVSYLSSNPLSPRSLTEEQGVQENQRQVLKGAVGAGDRTVSYDGPGSASNNSPKSSFIANRIDRASGISDASEISGDDRIPPIPPAKVAAKQVTHDYPGDAHEHFPKGIPASGPHEAAPRVSMDRSSFALLVAVILVLVVYAIVLPNRFMGESGSDSGGETSAKSANGNVIREEFASGQPESGGAANPPDLGNEGVVANSGKDTDLLELQSGPEKLSGSTADSGAAKEMGTRNALVSNPVQVHQQADKRQPESIPPVEQGPSTGSDDKKIQKTPAKSGAVTLSQPDRTTTSTTVTARKDASSATKSGGRINNGVEGASPSKKLESLRQTLQEEATIIPAPVAQGSAPESTRPASKGETVTETAKTQSLAESRAPSTVAGPASKTKAGADVGQRTEGEKPAPSGSGVTPSMPLAVSNQADMEPSVVASVAPVQPAPEATSISIQELDSLAETFSRAYESGNLDLLLSLFSVDAHTNDQSDRAGIAKDYQDLFQVSEKRKFIIDRLRWEQDRNGGLKGEGDFQVDVQLKSDNSVSSVKGKVIFYVKRGQDGVVITQMLHTYN